MADEERRRPGGSPDIIDEINALLRLGVGDQYRLEHIKLAYVENRTIWESDRRYLDRMREKYVADLRRGEAVDDDRDVLAADDSLSAGPAGGTLPPAPAPPPPPQPSPSASPDPIAVPDPAPSPAAAQPGSPESVASDAEDFGAGPDAAAAGPAVIHCWKCGKKNLLKANFCMRCGVLLFDVGNARAAADSTEYAASSAPPDAGPRRAAASAASARAASARAEAAHGEGGGSGKRAALIGVAALVGILLVVAVMTSSVEIELGGDADADAKATNATSGSPEAAAPAPVPAPEPPPP